MPQEKLIIKSKEITIDSYLKAKLDLVLKLQKNKWDVVFIVDGGEGSGKSTLALTCAWYLSKGTLTLNNLAEGTKDATNKLESLPDKSILVIDEGSLMFSSKDAMKHEQRQLIKILNVIRQKGMILIVVAPVFFDLLKYIAVSRSRFLLHVYTSNNYYRGRYCYFNEKKKKMLYYEGKKNYGSYRKPKALFLGRFNDFRLPFDEEYQAMKKRTLRMALHEEGSSRELSNWDIKQVMVQVIGGFRENTPEVEFKVISKALNLSERTLIRYNKEYLLGKTPNDRQKRRDY